MKILLKDFLRVVNNDEDDTVDSFCNVMLEIEDSKGKYSQQKYIGQFKDINLKAFEDYEVVKYYQTFYFGELDTENLILREVKK